jgi:pimeloyl-ACP methyl ester carboxylesterase
MPESDPHLLLVPGLGLTAAAWEPTVRALARRGVDLAQVTVMPMRGYGQPLDPADSTVPRDAARRLLDAAVRPDREYVLVGHSSSCQIVAHAAALAPDRVVGLVLVGPTQDPRAAAWPRLAGRWIANAVHETPRQVPFVVPQYRRTTVRSMLRTMDTARHDRIDETLAAVRCPVLVVRGAHDRIAPEDWCRALAPSVTLPRGAHMVPITDGDLLAGEVLAHPALRAPSGRTPRP